MNRRVRQLTVLLWTTGRCQRGKKIGKNGLTQSANRHSCTELVTKALAARFKAKPPLLCTLFVSPDLLAPEPSSPSSPGLCLLSLSIPFVLPPSERPSRLVRFLSTRSFSFPLVRAGRGDRVAQRRVAAELSHRMTLQRYATSGRVGGRRGPRGQCRGG